MYKIDYHADDYAISVNNSNRILELVRSKKLDSFSIISNMGCYNECMDILKKAWPDFDNKPLISVHLNLIDGYRLSSDNNDIQNNSWGKLFINSFVPSSKKALLKKQLTAEIKAQIKNVYDDTRNLLDNSGNPVELRLDSHVHTHMIPIVFDSMIDALKELELLDEVKYIRNSKEPVCMFFTTKGVAGTFSMINVIKNIILNMLGMRTTHLLKKFDIPTGMLWGLIMSGKMDHERISLLLPKMTRYASTKDQYLEILCHPGIVLPEEKRPEYGPDDLEAFFSSNRDIEYEMIEKRQVQE